MSTVEGSVVTQAERRFSWAESLKAIWTPTGHPVLDLTDEWFTARRGRLTASSRANVLLNGGPTSKNETLTAVLEELAPSYKRGPDESNKYMKWGRDHEDEALANLELKLGIDLIRPGFLLHPETPFIGGTPDGTTADRKVSVQIKCPYMEKNHMKFLYDKSLPEQYYTQVQVEAAVLGATDIIFASYNPRFPIVNRLAVIEVKVQPSIIDKLLHDVEDFRRVLETGSSFGVLKPVIGSGVPSLF